MPYFRSLSFVDCSASAMCGDGGDMWRLCCFLTCKNKGSPQFSLKLPSIRDILRGFQRGNTGQGRASCPGGSYRVYKLEVVG